MNRNRQLTILCCFFITLIGISQVGVPSAVADWPEFLGPTGQSISSSQNLPTSWSETKNVRWFSKTEGLGWSSPILVGNAIYFTTAVDRKEGEGKSLELVSLDLETGSPRFSKKIFELSSGTPEIHPKNSHASPTPFYFDGKLYLHFGHEGTACTDLEGNIQWTNRDHKYPPTHGNGSSPIVVGGLLIMTCDGSDDPYTLALDRQTGKEVWRTPRGIQTDRKFSFCTPTLIEVNGRKQVISAGSDILQALNPESGEVLWFARFVGYSLTVRPMMVDGMLYMSTGFNRPSLLAFDPTGSGDVTTTHLRWEHKTNVPNTPSFIAHQQSIIMVNDKGVATCLDAKTGKEIWQKRVGGNYSASPLIAGDLAYFQSEDGESVVFKLGSTPTEISRNGLKGRIFASYAVHQNDLIIRSEHGVYRIGQ